MLSERKNKILIVEGQDRCGKTSFIKSYLKGLTNTKMIVIHCDAPPRNVDDVNLWSMRRYNNLMRECRNLWNRGYDVILDRSHIGEYVYGNIYRGTNPDWVFDLHQNIFFRSNSLDYYSDDLVPNVKSLVFTDLPENLVSRDDGNGLTSNLEGFKVERERWLLTFNELTLVDPGAELIDWSSEVLSFDDKIQELVKRIRG